MDKERRGKLLAAGKARLDEFKSGRLKAAAVGFDVITEPSTAAAGGSPQINNENIPLHVAGSDSAISVDCFPLQPLISTESQTCDGTLPTGDANRGMIAALDEVLSIAPVCSHDDIMTQWQSLNAAERAVARELLVGAQEGAGLPDLVYQYRHLLYQCISVINGQKRREEEIIEERQAEAATSLQTLERQHELLSLELASAKLDALQKGDSVRKQSCELERCRVVLLSVLPQGAQVDPNLDELLAVVHKHCAEASASIALLAQSRQELTELKLQSAADHEKLQVFESEFSRVTAEAEALQQQVDDLLTAASAHTMRLAAMQLQVDDAQSRLVSALLGVLEPEDDFMAELRSGLMPLERVVSKVECFIDSARLQGFELEQATSDAARLQVELEQALSGAAGTAMVVAPASALVPVNDLQHSALASQHAALLLENRQLQGQVDTAERERVEIVSDCARQNQLLKQQLLEASTASEAMKCDVSSLLQRNDKLQEVVSQLKEQVRVQGDQAAAVARSKTEALSSLVAARTELETATTAYSSLQQAHGTVLGRLRAAVCPEPGTLTDAAVLDCICASFVDASTSIHNYKTQVEECARANTLLTQQLASAEMGLARAEQALQDSSAVLARHKAEIAELASCKLRLEACESQQAQQLQVHSQQVAELQAQRDIVMSRCQYLEELQSLALLSRSFEVTTEVNARVEGDSNHVDVLSQRANMQDAALREINLVADLNQARTLLSSQNQTIQMLKDELQSAAARSVEPSRPLEANDTQLRDASLVASQDLCQRLARELESTVAMLRALETRQDPCHLTLAVTADVHILASERQVHASLELQSVELLARLQDSQGSIARLESMVAYLRSRLDNVEDLRLAYLHSQNEVAAQRDQVELLHRERDRLVKHHVMLEDALTEEILLLERQNLQLQESLTRTSAAADRAAGWAKEASDRYEQAVASGNGVVLLQHNSASLRSGDGAQTDRELLQRELQRVQAQLHEANRKAAEFEALALSARKSLEDSERLFDDEKAALRQQVSAKTMELVSVRAQSLKQREDLRARIEELEAKAWSLAQLRSHQSASLKSSGISTASSRRSSVQTDV